MDAADASIVYVALKTPLASGDRCEIALSYAADIPEGGLRCGYFPLHTEARLGAPSSWRNFIPCWPSMKTADGSLSPIS